MRDTSLVSNDMNGQPRAAIARRRHHCRPLKTRIINHFPPKSVRGRGGHGIRDRRRSDLSTPLHRNKSHVKRHKKSRIRSGQVTLDSVHLLCCTQQPDSCEVHGNIKHYTLVCRYMMLFEARFGFSRGFPDVHCLHHMIPCTTYTILEHDGIMPAVRTVVSQASPVSRMFTAESTWYDSLASHSDVEDERERGSRPIRLYPMGGLSTTPKILLCM